MAVHIFTKGMLIILNFLSLVLGLGMIALGVMVKLGLMQLEVPEIATGYQTVSIVLIVVGTFIALIAFMGCGGAISDSNCILAVHAILKVLLMILFIGAAVLVFVKQQMFVDYLMRFEDDLFSVNQSTFGEVVEAKFECCGLLGPGSYSKHPSSTCYDGFGLLHPSCSDVTPRLVHRYAKYIGGGFIGMAFLELIGVVISLCHASVVRRNEKY